MEKVGESKKGKLSTEKLGELRELTVNREILIREKLGETQKGAPKRENPKCEVFASSAFCEGQRFCSTRFWLFWLCVTVL